MFSANTEFKRNLDISEYTRGTEMLPIYRHFDIHVIMYNDKLHR